MHYKEKKNSSKEKEFLPSGKKSQTEKQTVNEMPLHPSGVPEIRYLKIQPLYRVQRQSCQVVPQLRLNGRWLERAGFAMDEYVTVTVMEGLLIIRSGPQSGNTM